MVSAIREVQNNNKGWKSSVHSYRTDETLQFSSEATIRLDKLSISLSLVGTMQVVYNWQLAECFMPSHESFVPSLFRLIYFNFSFSDFNFIPIFDFQKLDLGWVRPVPLSFSKKRVCGVL
jgi:hypothetical protein